METLQKEIIIISNESETTYFFNNMNFWTGYPVNG